MTELETQLLSAFEQL
ncbi:MbeD/MobD family mobilization/exclusion protein, partial [Klebsiella pneumoniae]